VADAQIAAIAGIRRMIVATRDVKDFEPNIALPVPSGGEA
jgi:predicted nucleic acid-binding protein